MINIAIVVLALILLFLLLYFEKVEKDDLKLFTKTCLSLLFIVAALVQSPSMPLYFYLIVLGLFFSLGGDVFLALRQERMFLGGIISFLIGHLFYIFAFFQLAKLGGWTWVGALAVAFLSGVIYYRLKDYLGELKKAVIVYILVISLMLIGAWNVLGEGGLNEQGRMLVFAGAFLFYLSDILVARDRFMKKAFINRLVGLPLYYVGQFMLAFSVGFLP